jgi:hypothetical protein
MKLFGYLPRWPAKGVAVVEVGGTVVEVNGQTSRRFCVVVGPLRLTWALVSYNAPAGLLQALARWTVGVLLQLSTPPNIPGVSSPEPGRFGGANSGKVRGR